MEDNSSKIVYKKNAFCELKEDLSKYYYGKNVLIITTKSLINGYLTEIMNSVSLAGCSFKHFVAKNNFSKGELIKLSEMLTQENFDLYIVFGAGRATNVTKYFANIFCVPYMVCPSACSSLAYFNNICINPYDSTRSFVCDEPECIYICEGVIKTVPRKLVKQGIFLIMSLEELLTMASIENILFDEHKDYGDINKIILKLSNELKCIMSGDDEGKLILMDTLIDLSKAMKNIDVFKTSLFNLYCILQKMFEENDELVGCGETFLLASSTLMRCYKNLFSQKTIKQLELPNFPKIVKNIEKYSIFYKKINNFAYFSDILSKKELLVRLNNLKEEFLYQTNKRLDEQNEMLNIIKRYDNVFTYQTPQIKSVFGAVGMLPFVSENNYVVSLMGGLGMFNYF